MSLFQRSSRMFLSSVSMAAMASSMVLSTILLKSSSSKSACSYSNFGLPISSTILSMRSSTGCSFSCACTMPSYITSSGTWSAAASIMTTFLCVAATVTVMRLVSRSALVGLKRYFSPSQPRLMPAMGPLKGDVADAHGGGSADHGGDLRRAVAVNAQHLALDGHVVPEVAGKSGRMGRSIRRLASTAGRLGRPSRRMKLPGMRPTA